jgi:hypothetical protein
VDDGRRLLLASERDAACTGQTVLDEVLIRAELTGHTLCGGCVCVYLATGGRTLLVTISTLKYTSCEPCPLYHHVNDQLKLYWLQKMRG